MVNMALDIKGEQTAYKSAKVKFANIYKNHGDITIMGKGQTALNGPEMWGTSGHFYSGSKQMTAQMFGNPDLIYTKDGVWESVVISDYTFASFGPFRARSKGKRKFEFYEDIHYHIHRGYDMSVLFGNTLGSGMAAQSAITNKMASFLTAVHNVNVSPVRVMSFNKVTNSELLTKVALRPEVNLVQAGQAYNAAINNMLKTITKKKKRKKCL